MFVEPTIGLALLAGFVSFISPCVLPLVPAYVGYMSGHATNALGETLTRGKFSTFLHGVAFVLGFTIFFVGFGLLTAAAARTLEQLGIDIPTILTRLGGVAVIFFGLYVMKALDPVFRRGLVLAERLKENQGAALAFSFGLSAMLIAYYLWVFDAYRNFGLTSIMLALILFLLTLALFRKPMQRATSLGDFWYQAILWLQTALISDTRRFETQQRGGYFGSVGIGLVFAAGWTPCIGPIYGSILTLASDAAIKGDSLLPAGGLLTAYSLGLGIPFLITAMALNQMGGLMRGLKRNMRKVEYASGGLLILIGLLILTGRLEAITRQFGTGELGDFSVRLEACTAGVADGRVRVGSWADCVGGGAPKLNDRVIFAALSADSKNMPEGVMPLFRVDPSFDPESISIGLQRGQRAPEIVTTTPDGEEISLADFYGEVVLLNFWATWCGPCRVEMPEFQALYDELHERGFSVLAVNVGETPAQVQEFADQLGLSFPFAMDSNFVINDRYRLRQFPTTYILDGHGVIIAAHAGTMTGAQVLSILEDLSAGG